MNRKTPHILCISTVYDKATVLMQCVVMGIFRILIRNWSVTFVIESVYYYVDNPAKTHGHLFCEQFSTCTHVTC